MSDTSNNTNAFDTCNPTGSVWHRWDPHLHIPGTLHNDDFAGGDDAFLKRMNAEAPVIRVIGITDYYVLDSYIKALEWHVAGLLPAVAMIFPNIELRFAVSSGKGSPINVHLLVSPEDDDHVEQAERFLNELKFKYKSEPYHCTRADLIRLGRSHDPALKDELQALKVGSEQFKVDPDSLIAAFEQSAWARANILIAIAASSKDGTAQLQTEGGLTATRRKLERAAHIIFSSKPGDREFWLGKTKMTPKSLNDQFGGLKPCLHGSDHFAGQPALQRYCWLKGDLTFDTLRQACIEPEGRAFVGEEAPKGGFPSSTIVGVSISDADWIGTPKVPINAGLVAVIGERGSGKTALVEMIAAGSNSIEKQLAKKSFLARARELITTEVSTVDWGVGDPTLSPLDIDQMPDEPDAPRVRYLSQQFVDQLCSSDGLADELLSEIERVIFLAHSADARYGASSFSELRETTTAASRRAKDRYKATLAELADELSIQRDLERSLGSREKQRSELVESIKRDKIDRKKITPSENKPLIDRLDTVRSAAEFVSQDIASLNKQHLDLSGLKEEAEQFRDFDSDAKLRTLKEQYPNAGFSDTDWGTFKLAYGGDVENLLNDRIRTVLLSIENRKGPAKGEAVEAEDIAKAPPYFSEDAALSEQTLSLLLKEQRRLEALLGVDTAKRKRYTQLSEKIEKSEAHLKKLDGEIAKAKAATAKIAELVRQRGETYRSIFGEVVKEESTLRHLYKPLEERLAAQEGPLSKLTFSVRREVSLVSWTEEGESHLDVRKQGPFRGRGALHEKASETLANAWQAGDPVAVAEAMSTFRDRYGAEMWKHVPDYASHSREARKAWSDKVSAWLFGTDHIEVSYGLQYEETDIEQLSPGTRGIVLLLLYLSIDRDDDRPLIIDQPEENLDPKSIFDELVDRFKEAKMRRQVIIVTHNANLVVNTDADQVIVASRGEHRQGKLPVLTYQSGGLDNPAIRESVCEILEGGEAAFRERARRLRLSFD